MIIKQLLGGHRRLFADEDGSTAMEYALIAVLIGIAIIASVSVVSQNNQKNFNSVDEALSAE